MNAAHRSKNVLVFFYAIRFNFRTALSWAACLRPEAMNFNSRDATHLIHASPILIRSLFFHIRNKLSSLVRFIDASNLSKNMR